MRLFFGLELQETTTLKISDWRDRQFSGAGRPVPPANFHVTLAFIGQLSAHRLERLLQAVDHMLTTSPLSGGALTLDQTGYWHKPGIYWLGPEAWPAQLDSLALRLGGLSSSFGAKRDKRPYRPHITLFRGCADAPPIPSQAPSIELTYRDFTLFESRQGRHGVSYHPLQCWELAPPFG